jgi:small subunit ribosomal protein S9
MAEEQEKVQAPEEKVQAPAEAAAPPAAPPAPVEAPPAPPVPAPEPAPSERAAKPFPPGTLFIWGTGRRKKAVARVRIRPGTGKFVVNKREMEKYFVEDRDRNDVLSPLQIANMLKSWDSFVNVNGGGFAGQAGAVTLGLARALAKAMPEVEQSLRDKRLMTRDSRMKERKKYGQKGARKRFQYSKR